MPYIFSSKSVSIRQSDKVVKLHLYKIDKELTMLEKEQAEYVCISNNRPFKSHNYNILK